MTIKKNQTDVVILGGGVAGLSAAVCLAEAGLTPLLLEASKTLGGRARSYWNNDFQENLDNGPHLLMGAYQHTLDLLTQIGSRHLLLEEKPLSFTFWSQEFKWHQLTCPNWPAPWHLLAGLSQMPGITHQDLFSSLRLIPALLESKHSLEKKSVTQWLQSHNQLGTLFRRVWQPLCLATLNEPPASANALVFSTVLKKIFLNHRKSAQPLIPKVPLSQLFADPAQKMIEKKGGEVRTSWRVQNIHFFEGMVQNIQCNRGIIHPPKAVISALPHKEYYKLFPHKNNKIGLQNAPIVSVHLTYDEPCQLPTSMVGVPLQQSQWIFDRGRLLGHSEGHSKVHSEGGRFSAAISGAYRESHTSQEQLIQRVHQDIVHLIPKLAHTFPSKARVIKEKKATFSAWPESSHYRPKSQSNWKNMWLAGDWIDTGLPSTLEGATISGRMAAKKVLDFLASEG